MKKRLFILLFFFFIPILFIYVRAAEIQVGNLERAISRFLITDKFYSWSATIYLKDEIPVNGEISSLSFNIQCWETGTVTPREAGGFTLKNQKIYLANCSGTYFEDGTKPDPTGFTNVFNGDIRIDSSGWIKVQFDTKFDYDNNYNLIVYWESHDGEYDENAHYGIYSFGSSITTKHLYCFNSKSFPDRSTDLLYSKRPVMKFELPIKHDLQVVEWLEPQTGVLFDNENISIKITNSGDSVITNPEIGYIVKELPLKSYYEPNHKPYISIETYSGTIAPKDTVIHTFSSPVDLTVTGDPLAVSGGKIIYHDRAEYECKAFINDTKDMYALNDTVFENIWCYQRTSKKDSLALAALYNNLDGTNWLYNDNWLELPVRTWENVEVVGEYVKSLNLRYNNLKGELPAEIGLFEKIETLLLYHNEISGEIPPEIGQLDTLMELDIDNNLLTGDIPPEIGNLKNLRELYLEENNLSGEIPPEIGNLTELNHLWMNDNNLNGEIPDELYTLTKLYVLVLSNNNLTGTISSDISNLSYLISFIAPGNKLSGTLPSELFELKLSYLSLANNDYNGTLNKDLGNLRGITVIDLSNNEFSGEIPKEIGNITFEYDYPNEPIFILSNNSFTGNIPDEIGSISGLYYFFADSNQFDGDIPNSFFLNPTLKSLHLEYNNLAGEIPRALGSSNLQYLDLSNNNLSGNIPDTIGNMGALLEISLANNNLEGKIPECITNLSNLTYIDFHNNNLTGTLPSDLFSTNLQKIFLQYNQLSGGLPKITTNYKLYDLYLAGNQIKDSIPVTIDNLYYLRYLWLGSNKISGNIPEEIGNNSNLQGIWLEDNMLTGGIPKEIGNLDNLHYLNLRNNELTDTIPEEIGGLSNLLSLNLRNNNLCGPIPLSLANLSKITSCYLSDNKLSGEVPEGIAGLENLSGLWLHNNQLSSLPDLSNLPIDTTFGLTLEIANNKFTFRDIKPNISVLPVDTMYSPQAAVGFKESLFCLKNDTLTLNPRELAVNDPGASQLSYEWFINSLPAPEYSDTLVIKNNFSLSDTGNYHCHISCKDVENLVLTTTPVNVKMVDFILDNDSLPENMPKNYFVGNLNVIVNEMNSIDGEFLLAGSGNKDNNSFIITEGKLLSNAVFNYEEKFNYTIDLTSVLSVEDSIVKSFAIKISDENDKPSMILLSNNSLDENSPVGSIIGTLETIDEDVDDDHTYTLNTSFSDYVSFTLDGNMLLNYDLFDFEFKDNYHINIKTTDSRGEFLNQNFAIYVNDVLETSIPATISTKEWAWIYPNPAKNLLTIQSNWSKDIQINIYNTQGILFYKTILFTEDKLTLQTSDWPVGIYIVNMTVDNWVQNLKLSIIARQI